jgi:hypothetical protein
MIGGVRARIEIDGDDVVVIPIGLMRLWAMHGRIRLPIADIVEAVVLSDRRQRPGGARSLGTHTRGICAGTYRTRNGRELWFVGDGRGALELSLRRGRFARVVAQVEEPQAFIERSGLPTTAPGVRRVERA